MMMFPTQGMAALAESGDMVIRGTEVMEDITLLEQEESDVTSESTELSDTSQEHPDSERIQETLPLEPLEDKNSLDGVTAIYWNPGGSLPGEQTEVPVATASEMGNSVITVATSSNADGAGKITQGSDRADGYSPEHPVKTLETALKQADRLVEEYGLDKSDITIYAMNPMEIPDGRMYVLNAGNIRIASWPGRTYHNDTIFYVNGGQMTLINVLLESGSESADADETELIRVKGGALQLGQNVLVEGRIVMDYRRSKEQAEWEKASGSNAATSSNASAKATASNWTEAGMQSNGFDIDNYILSTDENEWELLEDKTQASTWREPIIELTDGFEGLEEGYLLEIRSETDDREMYPMVKTLYADEMSEEEYAGYFRLTDSITKDWEIFPVAEVEAVIRNTSGAELKHYRSMLRMGDGDASTADDIQDNEQDGELAAASRKIIYAARTSRAAGGYIYWNPGPDSFTVDGITYNPGNDENADGSTPERAVRSWNVAVSNAASQKKTIICMQSVRLGSTNADIVLPQAVGDSVTIESPGKDYSVTVIPWSSHLNSIFIIPEGETLELRNIRFGGIERAGNEREAQAVYSTGGKLVIHEGVTADKGFIQIDASENLKGRPVQVTSIDGGTITLYFGGINTNLSHRYTDVVIPADELADRVQQSPMDANAVGAELMGRFRLQEGNLSIEQGGNSNFGWQLRQDSDKDLLDGVHPENLELYAEFYYEAVYLDGVRGNDTYNAATCYFPVKTWAQARSIWSREMTRALTARAAARAEGKTEDTIINTIPLPLKIYICDTVTIEGEEQNWKLETVTDNGISYETEVVSHNVPPLAEGSTTAPVHPMPKTLVEVKGAAAKLTLTDVAFRNITDETDSVTIEVKDGAALHMEGTTELTGTRKVDIANGLEAREVTRGAHIKALSGAKITLDTAWTGNIGYREQGLVADGQGTTVTMNGGSISKNNAFHAETSHDNQKKGAGVALSGGAVFTMDGGTIAANKVYQTGGGVYAEGAGTTFTMNKGSVTGNIQARTYLVQYDESIDSTNQSWYLKGEGIGIYGGKGTFITIGKANGAQADASVSNNAGRLVDGAGIYAAGSLHIANASITGNSSDTRKPNSTDDNTKISNIYSRGGGIHVAENGTLVMSGSRVAGNGAGIDAGGIIGNRMMGGGIYLAKNAKGNTVTNTVISENRTGIPYSTRIDNSGGGAVYMSEQSELTLKDCEVAENQGTDGGGIFAYSRTTNSLNHPELVIEGGRFYDNRATGTSRTSNISGKGGAMYACYVRVEVRGGTEFFRNQASDGGAVYVQEGSKTAFLGSEEKPIKIYENTAKNIAGGFFLEKISSNAYFGHVKIHDNKSATHSGGVYNNEGITAWYECDINENAVSYGTTANGYGGGVYSSRGEMYLTNCRIKGNSAKLGGGIYNESTIIYFNEDAQGKAEIGNNKAKEGGGIYQKSGDIYLDFGGEMKNLATKQGANLYQVADSLYITSGNLMQPDEEERVQGVYNVYLEATQNYNSILSLNPNKVTLEKKTDGAAEAVYLNTPNGYLVFFEAPVSAVPKELPIDVNEEAFSIGSVVVKPYAAKSLTVHYVNNVFRNYSGQEKTLSQLTKSMIDFTGELLDASVNVSYCEGGDLPRRTQLGGFQDSLNAGRTNMVLLGEGIYLDGDKGDDANAGTAPADAVKTFEKARDILERKVKDKAAAESVKPEEEREGYTPYIYLCGTVTVPDKENWTWKLDYTDPLYTVTNEAFERSEKILDSWQTGEDDTNYKAQIRRFASFLNAPMIQVGSSSTSVSTLTMDTILINGMGNAVVTDNQRDLSPVAKVYNNSKLVMREQSVLCNNYYQIIQLYGRLVMENQAKIRDADGDMVEVKGSRASIEMKNMSSIVSEHRTGSNTSRYGIRVKGNYIVGDIVTIDMSDDCLIGSMDRSDVNQLYSGIYVVNGNVNINMNTNIDAKDLDSARIRNCQSAVYVSGRGRQNITMKKQSMLDDNIYAVDINKNNNSAAQEEKVTLTMKDDSRIVRLDEKGGTGIQIGSNIQPIAIVMEDNSLIGGYGTGIASTSHSSSSRRGLEKLDLTMGGHASISGNSSYGIYAGYTSAMQPEEGDYFNITMKDYATIGAAYGDQDANGQPDKTIIGSEGENRGYTPGKLRSGNKSYGIITYLPAKITLSGWASVRYNHTGLYATRSSSYYSSGNGILEMKDDSSIEYNIEYDKYYQNKGVNLIHINASTPNPWEATLTGRAVIADNAGYVYVGEESVVKLQDNSRIGKAHSSNTKEDLYAMEVYGKMELAGTSTVGDVQADGSTVGRIYLRNEQNPITMTSPASGNREYHLQLEEDFVGQAVVRPGQGMPTLNAPDNPQLQYYRKDVGDGLAETKSLKELGTDIVLAGENNVYLSTGGNDAHNGVTPATPVRTFRQAKWLLENGDFTEGANILICDISSGGDYTGINVDATDTEWAFDPGGTVTNVNNHQTWKPVITRYKAKYASGRLITIQNGVTVDFHDITIDGGYPENQYSSTNIPSEMMMVYYNGKAVLGENCILQNNRITYGTSHSSLTEEKFNPLTPGIRVLGGTLEINGATLQGLERQFSASSYVVVDGKEYGAIPLASAVSVEDYTVKGLAYHGKVIMNSGRIENNRVHSTARDYRSYYSAGAVIVYNGGEFVMNGGVITGNEFNGSYFTDDPTDAHIQGGGGLVVHNAKATINSGTIRGNTGYRGSNLYYYDDDKVTDGSRGVFLEGGQLRDGAVAKPAASAVAANSSVYVAGGNFQLAGGGCDIRDSIYLDSDKHIVKVSGSIYQTGRRYRIYINRGENAGQFRKGSAVVQPDGNYLGDVSGYLGYFEVASAPYIIDAGDNRKRTAGTVAGMTEERCLILRKAVYINGSDDSTKGGNDANDGTVPSRAVRTFERAKVCGETDFVSDSAEIRDYYVIYVCGEVNNGSSAAWELKSPAYMCRYTGFQTYYPDGTPEALQSAYYGVLVRPNSNLVLEELSIYGRRSMDTTTSNGSSLFEIEADKTVTIPAEALVIMGRNNNTGTYTDITTGIQHSVTEKGGAFLIHAGGSLDMQSGTISNTTAEYGNSIYLEADDTLDGTGAYRFGRLKLANALAISGAVYLDGTGTDTYAYIEADGSFKPPVDAGGNTATQLTIEVANDFGGRALVQYPDGVIPGSTQLLYYDFADHIKAIYDVVNRLSEPNVLELEQRGSIYLDGQNGSDSHDGTVPEKAFRTLERVYEEVAKSKSAGVMVYVVNTVAVSGSEEPIKLGNTSYTNPSTGISSYQGFFEQGNKRIDIEGQIYFKRYSKPTVERDAPGTLQGFDKDTLLAPLFQVEDGGSLSLNGIYVDGHSQPSEGSLPELVAPAVEAQSPLIRIQPGGNLECAWIKIDPSVNPNYTATYTLLTNNKNVNKKEEIPEHYIGEMRGLPVYEGSGAGIELIGDHSDPDYGTVRSHVASVTLKQTQFRNLELGENIAGGADVYSDGELHVADQVSFSGSVFMEGIGSTDEPKKTVTSRYIWADTYGTPIKTQFPLLVRDPYEGRVIQHFPENDIIQDNEIRNSALFRLEEDVTEFFYVGRDEQYKYQFILSVPIAVYIDGIAGNDDNDNAKAGATPDNPVKTLRRAYELLQRRAGYTIYVVNTIPIDSSMTLTGSSYQGDDGKIDLINTDKVQIMRYMQPDFAVGNPTEAVNQGYDVKDFTGPLLNVGGDTGGSVTLTMADNILINGHSENREGTGYPYQVIVTAANHGGAGAEKALEAKAPLIVVEEKSTLQLNQGAQLISNNNTYDEAHDKPSTGEVYAYGGAVHNSGTVNINGVEIKNNRSKYGSIAYQNGEFMIESSIENILDDDANAQNSFYLTTVKRGINASGQTVWGTDHIVKSQAAIPDGEIFQMEMDRAVTGRDVIQFTDPGAYAPDTDADAKHEHFRLGSTVPEELFLVVAGADAGVLELQDWKIIKAAVPEDIYLVVTRKGTIESSSKLNGVTDKTEKLFGSLEYQIVNAGRYDMKVSLNGVANDNANAGITKDTMNLKESTQAVIGEKDLYLAVKGLDTNAADGLTAAEIPLTEGTVTPSELGQLKAGSTGNFELVGKVGVGFVDKYKDLSFPLTGTAEEVWEYMDGHGPDGKAHACAKYLLKYKVELVSPRR